MTDDMKRVIEKAMAEYREMTTETLQQCATQLWDELFHPAAQPYLVETQVKRLHWVMILVILNERDI